MKQRNNCLTLVPKNLSTINDVTSLIERSKNIVVLTGAGISVSCGIPDFRSRDGLYARLAVDYPTLGQPQDMFCYNFFSGNPNPFYNFAKEIFPGKYKPSIAHRFISLLEKKQKLLRNYTQNIDTLEQEVGVKNVVHCHGSFSTATCLSCHTSYKLDDIKEDILNQIIPRCYCTLPEVVPNEKALSSSCVNAPKSNCKEKITDPNSPIYKVIKPDIVFFGESLPDIFYDSLLPDILKVDLLIVIGSSLKVQPVSLIPDCFENTVPKILINREPLSHQQFDMSLFGNCDVILSHILAKLNWELPEVQTKNGEKLPSVKSDALKKGDTTELLKKLHEEATEIYLERHKTKETHKTLADEKVKAEALENDDVIILSDNDSDDDYICLSVGDHVQPDTYYVMNYEEIVFPGAEYAWDIVSPNELNDGDCMSEEENSQDHSNVNNSSIISISSGSGNEASDASLSKKRKVEDDQPQSAESSKAAGKKE